MRILLVEDDAMIGKAVLDVLRSENLRGRLGARWAAADGALVAERYDLVLLDLGPAQGDGLTVLRGLRARRDVVPVLIATARDAIGDRVAGLDAGADDYIVQALRHG
jgi:two-component system OmpR family response regulator